MPRCIVVFGPVKPRLFFRFWLQMLSDMEGQGFTVCTHMYLVVEVVSWS